MQSGQVTVKQRQFRRLANEVRQLGISAFYGKAQLGRCKLERSVIIVITMGMTKAQKIKIPTTKGSIDYFFTPRARVRAGS